jgi:NAD(P)-dependent dehydrogenase (short-subunit alcohol dehydrogenase family)
MEFKEKLIVVTGAGRGLGRACAEEYAKEGAKIVLVDISPNTLSSTAKQLSDQGYKVHSFQCDLSSTADVERFGRLVLEDVGVPDIIHNNAMRNRTGSITNLEVKNVEEDLNINVLGYLRVVQAFLPSMISRGSGWIVNTASPLGLIPPRGAAEHLLSYCVSKAADISMSQSMAVALKQYNIGVTVLYPDMTLTEAADDIKGSAPVEFMDAFSATFKEIGKAPDAVAKIMVDGIKQQKFSVSAAPLFEKLLVEWAQTGMDPNATYSSHV